MAKFHKLKIADVRTETAECVSVSFYIPESLKNDFKFIQGQYLTLKLVVKGEEVRRSYSICSGVMDNELRVAVKRVKDGRGSNFINDTFKVGAEVEVMPPMGGFHSPMKAEHKKQYVLFSGGSGITPMLSIVKTVLQAESNSSLILFYGNLNEEATIFKKQLDEIATSNASRFQLHYIFDKPENKMDELYVGVMTKEKIKALLTKHITSQTDNEYFICGPGPMMDNARETLEGMRVDKKRIHIEYFVAAAPIASKDSVLEKITAKVSVSMYGMETAFDLNSNGKSILDAALDAGVDVPFACKGAVCATCRGRVLEGKVHMDKNFALTEEEIAEGFILTCQSHPTTAVVKVDYDV